MGLLGFAASGAIITGAAAAVTNAHHDHALLDLAGLGTLAGGLVFFLAIGLGRDAWKKIGTLLFFGDVTRVVPATEWMTEPEQVPFCLRTAGQLV